MCSGHHVIFHSIVLACVECNTGNLSMCLIYQLPPTGLIMWIHLSVSLSQGPAPLRTRVVCPFLCSRLQNMPVKYELKIVDFTQTKKRWTFLETTNNTDKQLWRYQIWQYSYSWVSQADCPIGTIFVNCIFMACFNQRRFYTPFLDGGGGRCSSRVTGRVLLDPIQQGSPPHPIPCKYW